MLFTPNLQPPPIPQCPSLLTYSTSRCPGLSLSLSPHCASMVPLAPCPTPSPAVPLYSQPHLMIPFSPPCRRGPKELVCLTPPSALGPGSATLGMCMDRAALGATRNHTAALSYRYLPDPSITAVDPLWSIAK